MNGRYLLDTNAVIAFLKAVLLTLASAAIGGCVTRSQQLRWLARGLAAPLSACILAYWRHPRFFSGAHGNDATVTDFWRVFYDAGADVVLVA